MTQQDKDRQATFEQVYNRVFAGQAVDNVRAANCEKLWNAAIAHDRQQCGKADSCGFVAVKESAVNWLKKHFPALCEKSGLCERVAGRLYTITRFSFQQSAEPVKGESSDETLRIVGVIADKIEDGTLFQAGIFSRRELAGKVRALLDLYAAQPGMVNVTQRDANNYCCILSILGMEEEGDPALEVQRLLARPAASAEPGRRDWKAIESAIEEYVDGYELRDGDGGDHIPTELERFLINDAIHGLLDDEFLTLLAAPVAASGEPVAETGAPGRRIHKWFRTVPQGTLLYAAPVATQPSIPEVPEGWKLVPIDPTPEMRKAAADAWLDCGSRMILNKAMAALKAGIDASPTPPADWQIQQEEKR